VAWREQTDAVYFAGAVTRVVRWSGPPAVVRVKTRADLIVAIPSALPRHEVLDLARLVLSGREYQQLRREIEHGPGTSPRQDHR
jgi:hypothetical protein